MKIRYLAVLLTIACMALGTAVALASPGVGAKHGKGSTDFAVLSKHDRTAKNASVQADGIPAGAALASNADGNDIYVFERTKGLEVQICIADRLTEMTAVTCGPNTTVEREGVDLILPNRDNTVAVLVPNGVSGVGFTKANTSETVAVANNVVVATGTITGYHYVTPTSGARTVALAG